MRLIDAEALPVNNRPTFFELIDAIEDAPTIDAVPVVHGRWDGGFPYPVYCSVCKSRPQMSVKTNYCPNCGARMDGE